MPNNMMNALKAERQGDISAAAYSDHTSKQHIQPSCPTLGALLATGFYLALKAIGYWRIDPDQDSTDTRHSAMHDTGFGTTGSRVGRPSDATFVDGGRGFNSNGPNVTAPAGTGKMYGGNAHTGTGIGSGPSPHASGLTGSQATYNPAGAGGGLGNTAAPGQSATPTYPSGAAAV